MSSIPDLTFKLLIIGNGGVGKTTLVSRYVTGVYTDGSITIGVDFAIKKLYLHELLIRLQVWDFGGEERFRFLLPTYCRGATGCLFIYDTTNTLSLSDIDRWLAIVHGNAGDIPMLMVGSKIDLVEKRAISYAQGIDTAKKHHFSGYAEVSSKTGDSVEDVFATISSLMAKKTLPELL